VAGRIVDGDARLHDVDHRVNDKDSKQSYGGDKVKVVATAELYEPRNSAAAVPAKLGS
jgi:hypothetical protein